jgi:hypothetical protein
MTGPAAHSSTEGTVVSTTLMATDPDGDSLNFSATGLPAGLAISRNGTISGAIATGAAGDYNVTVVVSDGSLTDSATFHWKVTGKPGRNGQ